MRAVINSKQLYAAFAALLLVAVVTPVAVAGAASATSSAVPVAKAVKQLKKQVAGLRQQLSALQGQIDGPRTPSGPAGGDLTGTYPNPLLKANAVGTTEIADNALTTPKIVDNAVTTPKLVDNAVTNGKIIDGAVNTNKISDGTILSEDLATDSVGSRALKGVTAVVGTGVSISAGQTKTASVTCPVGQMVIGGGFAWLDKEPNSIIASAPSEGNPNGTWVVEAQVDAGSNTLFPWANCLGA